MTDQPPAASPPTNRYGMVRPLQGRYVAGVCAALGHSTRTDPVLWRVILAVLVCFGGIGVLAYLVLWIFTPEEGDTASPVQALLGRGQSKTSPLLVAVFGVAGVLLLLFILPRPLYLVLLGASVVLVVLLLAKQAESGGPPLAGAPPGSAADATPPAPTGEPATGEPGLDEPVAPPPPGTAPAGAPGSPPYHPPLAPAASPPYGAPPPHRVPPATPPYAPPRPFAPHGPFAPPDPYPPAGRVAPPRPPRERSSLTALTIFSTLILIGILAVLHLAGPASVPAAGYVAVALAAVGAGLLVGAWLGRGRSLIAIGLVLVLALPVAHVASGWDGRGQPVATSITWLPEQVSDIEPRYGISFGEGELDLREVDFDGQRVQIDLSVRGGQIRVLVPPEVTVATDSDVFAGAISVADREVGGLFTDESITLPASVDPPAGELLLTLRVRFGNIEVTR